MGKRLLALNKPMPRYWHKDKLKLQKPQRSHPSNKGQIIQGVPKNIPNGSPKSEFMS